MKIIQPKLKRAYLETVYWWVDCEHRYHHLFKQDKEIDIKYQNTFYEFTNMYSVRRNIKGSDNRPVFALLDKLNNLDFVSRTLEGEPNLIDEIDETLPGRSIRSLLSKYATLINPKAYTMFDGRATAALNAYNKKNRHRKFNNYKDFYCEFKGSEESLIEQIKDDDIDYYLALCTRQGKSIDNDIFKRRLADKYLWIANTSRNE